MKNPPSTNAGDRHTTLPDTSATRSLSVRGLTVPWVRTVSRTGPGGVEVEWLAMGDGHLVAVRDARAVGGTGMGGDDYGYELVITELDLESLATSLDLPSTTSGSLAHAGAMDVRRFTAKAWTNVVFDARATGGSMNARLFVVAEVQAKFHAPARLLDDVVVTAALVGLSRVSFDIEQKIYRNSTDGELLISSIVKAAYLDADTMRPKRVPPSLFGNP